ncbi:hypothetical protein Trco_004523 [Trichoderma cornu-damae]|uniref:Metallo-beta-lactamase domain-containing protein n=1 Tax=Trichoderma cornu-damae TaxID=654480 RepID=A0A9P8QKY4_9HYPO|nr:hypothetical protein Trco_004523 [Trichoderma cornu-damae]
MALPPIEYDPAVFEPFAQVTVFDAGYGDGNMVDICQHDSTEPYKWRRVLIDTGPPSDDTRSDIKHCLRIVPRPRAQNSGDQAYVPPLDEFQITHVDLDHIGNAAKLAVDLVGLFDGWRILDNNYRCLFVFPHIPPPLPPKDCLDASWKVAEFSWLGSAPVNHITFKLKQEVKDWAQDLTMFGYLVKFTLDFPDTPSPGDGFEWDRINVVDDREIGCWHDIRFVYNEDGHHHENALVLSISMEIIDLEAPLKPVSVYQGEQLEEEIWLPDIRWVSTVSAPFPGPLIPNNARAQAPVARSLVRDIPQFRLGSNDAISKLGTEVEKLMRRGVASTENAVKGKHHYFLRNNGTVEAVQHYVNPTTTSFRDLGRVPLIEEYRQHTPNYDAEMDEIATNRSSVVTMFKRPDLGLKMLFTADAYDRNCDVRRTILSYDDGTDPAMNLSILKIPHHGSEVTVDASFYELVRAEVYLICGSHHGNIHRNPRLSTLLAIARGFGKQPPRASGKPFRLFFSNKKILDEYVSPSDKVPSAVAALINSQWGPKLVNNRWNYEVYRCRDGDFSSILFGALKRDDVLSPYVGLDEYIANNSWLICHRWNAIQGRAEVIY